MVEPEGLDIVVEVEERGVRHPRREVKARCAALTIGFAAFDAAVQRHPHDRVTLRHGARVIRNTHPEPTADYPGR